MPDDDTYEIRTLEDMLEIPEESLNDFLVDLERFLRSTPRMKALLDEIGDALSEGEAQEIVKQPTTMIWIDDGEHDMTVEIAPNTEDDHA